MKEVVVGIIINDEDSDIKKYLLVSSKKDFGKFTGYYYPPGGHVDDGETKQEALKREIQEELSLDLISAKIIAETLGDVQDQNTTWYECEVNSNKFVFDKQELSDANFFTREEMETLNIWPATRDFFDKFIFI